MSQLPTHPVPLRVGSAASSTRLLIIEDEQRISDLLARALTGEGYETNIVADGRLALRVAQRLRPDVILLDLMLPGRDGLTLLPDLCKKLPGVPVIILSARREAHVRVAGLRAGAVDYMIKPFSLDELLERMRLRLAQAPASASDVVESHGIRLDTRRREVIADGGTHALTNREFRLLEYLVTHAGVVVSRERLTADVWGYAFVSQTNIIDATVRRLRHKVGHDRIRSVRGTGYVFGR